MILPIEHYVHKLNRYLHAEIQLLQKKLNFTLVFVAYNEEEAEEIGERKARLVSR